MLGDKGAEIPFSRPVANGLIDMRSSDRRWNERDPLRAPIILKHGLERGRSVVELPNNDTIELHWPSRKRAERGTHTRRFILVSAM
jgi:hypothetical protein